MNESLVTTARICLLCGRLENPPFEDVLTSPWLGGSVFLMQDSSDTGKQHESQDQAAIEPAWRVRQKPDNEIPGAAAVEAVLAASEDLVVFVSGMSVFRNGI